jgi:isopentenyl-diphosphate delta-isomerase
MSDRIRLDGYLPVRLGAQVGFCQELSLEQLAVDVAEAPAAGSPVVAALICSDRLEVVARGTTGAVIDGAPAGLHRVPIDVSSFDGAGREALVGHISSLRKSAHLDIVARHDVEAAAVKAGWDRWRFPHSPLPERHPDALDLSTTLFGHRLAAPVMISGMTGGSERAGLINRRLAEAAQELGLAMGLGSQRAMLEDPSLARTFAVRDVAPDILLLANVGAVQLNLGVAIDDVRRLIDAVQADALALHLNVLQELVQPEGDRDWAGLRPRIEALIAALDVPVILKETGCGMTGSFARLARDLGASGIDVGGTGGTSWGWIEGFRAADPQRQALGATFRDWGVPTADAVQSCRAALGPRFPIVATGGVRTGLDAATAVALGADVAGMALPFFRAADASPDGAVAFGRRIVEEIRVATLCSGAASARGLRDVLLEPR